VTGAALRTQGLGKAWGGFHALAGVDLTLPAGARHALIGPNGAGKTTLIHLLAGTHRPSAGEIYLGEERITALAPHARARRGLSRTFQVTALFPRLTPLESVVLAICERDGQGAAWSCTVASRAAAAEEALALLATFRLERDADAPTCTLPYGKQRLLEIALALAGRPRFLLLDEPAAGVPSGESAAVFEAIARLPRDVAILFIEHDMDLVFRFAERITVLVAGRILTEGTPAEIAADRRVREVYLGEAVHG
jgi:branched-chain amino acid transport system ATP-binding protein